MLIPDYRGVLVDESDVIMAQSLDQFEPTAPHDWRTCDCSAKGDRLIELSRKSELTEAERVEQKSLIKVLENSNVLD